MKSRRLLFSATNAQDLTPTFLEPKKVGWLETLKATSALPFLYKQGVKIGDTRYVDRGGLLPSRLKKRILKELKRL